MKSIIKPLSIICLLFVFSTQVNAQASCSSTSSTTGSCTAYSTSGSVEHESFQWLMNCPTGNIGYDLRVQTFSNGYGKAMVYMPFYQDVQVTTSNTYNTNQGSVSGNATSEYVEGRVEALNASTQLWVTTW